MSGNKLKNLIRRGIVTNATPDTLQFPRTQLKSMLGERPAEEIYQYGTFGVAPDGSLALIFNVLGEDDNQAAITYSPKLRPKDAKVGEYFCGNFLRGGKMSFLDDGSILAESKGGAKIILSGEDTTITLLGLVNLGEGGQPIARVGDSVNLSTGVIISGSANHKAS